MEPKPPCTCGHPYAEHEEMTVQPIGKPKTVLTACMHFDRIEPKIVETRPHLSATLGTICSCSNYVPNTQNNQEMWK